MRMCERRLLRELKPRWQMTQRMRDEEEEEEEEVRDEGAAGSHTCESSVEENKVEVRLLVFHTVCQNALSINQHNPIMMEKELCNHLTFYYYINK